MKKRLLITFAVFVVLALTTVTAFAAGGPVEAEVYTPPTATNPTCEAMQQLLTIFPDSNFVQDLADCDLAPMMPQAWEIPAGMVSEVPSGHYIQGDVQIVISSTVVTTGTLQLDDMMPVYRDSDSTTGELTWVYTDTLVYAEWGATVTTSEEKPLSSAYLEMRRNGCDGGCRFVYLNAVKDTPDRMTTSEILDIFKSEIEAMLGGGH